MLHLKKISARIHEKLAEQSRTPSNGFIFKVHDALRTENEKAYEPEMLSIGPYHHGKKKLQKMEKYKLRYLEGILDRQKEASAERYIAALVEVEEKARNYYTEDVSLSPDDFVEMMLLDGCFIIEFLRKFNYSRGKLENDDPIFSMGRFLTILCKDLLLFENQLPFFILEILFDMTKIPGQEENLIHLAISCLYRCIAADNPTEHPYNYINNQRERCVVHLLNLIYESWCSSLFDKEDNRSGPLDQKRYDFSVITFCQPFKRVLGIKSEQVAEDPIDKKFIIRRVCELKDYGIEFEKANQGTPWPDIKFHNGLMQIPTLVVRDTTESLLRNLIAYEEYMIDPGHFSKVITDYITFMGCLVSSSDDVKMLHNLKIIKNWLHNDEAVSVMFNKIFNSISLFPSTFSYLEIFKQVNAHCNKQRHIGLPYLNRWIARLRRRYFVDSPWSIIALQLTLVQTVFAVLQQVLGNKVTCDCNVTK